MKKIFNKILFYLVLSISVYPAIDANAENLEGTQIQQVIDGEQNNNIYTNETIEVFNNNGSSSSLYISQSDIDLMAKLVYAESRGEPFEGKVAVASVVLNRVTSPQFPNTVTDVIFQSNAFSCVKNNEIVANPDQSCYDAVYESIKGVDPTNDALFFYNPAIATCSWMKSTNKRDVTTIGNHVFFKS